MMITHGSIGVHVKSSQALYELPKFSFFGDYQILLNLKSIYNYRTYFKSGQEYELTKLMCVHYKTFLEICELYPKTADNFKTRSLERRERIDSVIKVEYKKDVIEKS